jgi:transketolase
MPAKLKSVTIGSMAAPSREAEQDRASDQLCINTIRTLAMDAVQQANSGHPGTPMPLAPLVYTLWQSFLRFDPDDPSWPNRDRFVLSNGHASMLLYAMLHLSGVKAVDGTHTRRGEFAVTLDDIKRFRHIDSKCPGHPEYHQTSGVETTTGPLGQGCGNSVGMALAGRWLARRFNRVVKAARARGDFKVLAERDRRVLRIHLGAHVAAGLTSLKDAVPQALA